MANSFQFKSFAATLTRDIDKAENRALMKAARHLRKVMRAKLNTRRVSQPGEAPGRVTGDLSKGAKIDNHRKGHKVFVGVGAPAHHAHLLEFGTAERVVAKTGARVGRVAPRPFLGPTFEEEQGEVQKILSERWL